MAKNKTKQTKQTSPTSSQGTQDSSRGGTCSTEQSVKTEKERESLYDF